MTSFSLSKLKRHDLIVLSDISYDDSYAYAFDRVISIFDMESLNISDALNAMDQNHHIQLCVKAVGGVTSKICAFSIPYLLPKVGLNPVHAIINGRTEGYLSALTAAKESAYRIGRSVFGQAGHVGANLLKVKAYPSIYSPFFSFKSFESEEPEEVRIFNSTFKTNSFGCLLELGGTSNDWSIDLALLGDFQLCVNLRKLTIDEFDQINENTRGVFSLAKKLSLGDTNEEETVDSIFAVSVSIALFHEDHASLNDVHRKFVTASNQRGLPFVRHGLALESSLRSFMPGQGFLVKTPLYFSKDGALSLCTRMLEATHA